MILVEICCCEGPTKTYEVCQWAIVENTRREIGSRSELDLGLDVVDSADS